MELTVTAKPNETPEQHMTRLGKMAQEIMDGRVKAMRAGLTPIHNALVQITEQIDAEQSRLLTAHPELIMMVMSQGVNRG